MHPEKIGKYEIQGELGEGGMGVVYKGFDQAIGRNVAIKAIDKSSVDAEELKYILERFRVEAQAVGRLVHPRIVQIYDFGEDEQTAYIVMELINGKTLRQHLAQEASYEIREIGVIIGQVLDGIGHAHSEGVIHRDIKPGNIMINSDGRIKISDFGIARIDSSHLTQVGEILGTPYYMAPEQFIGAAIDPPADLYSVGVIAYELLTGRKPFVGKNYEVMQQAINELPANPSQLNAVLSPLMDRVLQKALAKKPEDRFQSAREFAEAFREAIDATLAVSPNGSAPPPPAPDSAALLNAARLLNTGSMKAIGNAPPVLAGDSAISLDDSVKKARVLLIDDEERILSALKSLFRDRYHVFTTTDGHKALDFIHRYHMHVIVSDQRMPEMVGVELLRQCKEISPRSVRILLTGYSDLAAIVGSINDGEVYRFISKPWDNTELQTIVAEAVTIALELADTNAAAVVLPARMEAGVLVVDSDEEIFRVVRELVGDQCPVIYAAELEGALAAIEKQEIAVVITDVESGQEQLSAMLKILKQEYPRIQTIVATKASDSELVIELINQAQIFRFLNKPVNVRLMNIHVLAALQRYLTYKQVPKLVDAHRVQTSGGIRTSFLGRRILAGIGSLRGKWFGGG
ncbi:MAG: response regulator [Betaproteobacteria bacterium]|nr:response regulator [Betaproteobacteria bacterium]